VEAEIQFWPFKNNQYTQTPDSEVQNIIDTYENILIQ